MYGSCASRHGSTGRSRHGISGAGNGVDAALLSTHSGNSNRNRCLCGGCGGSRGSHLRRKSQPALVVGGPCHFRVGIFSRRGDRQGARRLYSDSPRHARVAAGARPALRAASRSADSLADAIGHNSHARFRGKVDGTIRGPSTRYEVTSHHFGRSSPVVHGLGHIPADHVIQLAGTGEIVFVGSLDQLRYDSDHRVC